MPGRATYIITKKAAKKPFASRKRVEGYDSNIEHKRSIFLKTLQKLGVIKNLQQQKKFELTANDHHMANYIADFTYIFKGQLVVEDTKSGFLTPTFRIKAKLMQETHGIEVIIVTSPKQEISTKNIARN